MLILPESNPDHSDPTNWRRSAEIHGAPGGNGSENFADNAEEDLDGDGLSALLEYMLGTSDTEFSPSPWKTGASVNISRRINADYESPGQSSVAGMRVIRFDCAGGRTFTRQV